MNLLKSTLIIFFLTTLLYCSAQQNNIWYFGRKAGLNFNSFSGQAIPSILTNSAMIANEGCSSISDSTGNLLFYTNGVTVYNRNHQVMLNGDGLLANLSSSQGAIIIPVPGNPDLFYIFTTDAVENAFANGYKYSILDMSMDNGDGALVTKNSSLWPSCTERLTAARHQNGVDVWIITNDRNSNIFRTWLLTCNGLNLTPVVSAVGTVLDQHNYVNTGVIKVSPDGKQLCQTHFPIFDETVIISNFIQLFDFDNATGVISNARSISFPATRFTHCEYSPNSKLLYVSRLYDKAVDQFEITLSTIAAIEASRITFPTLNPCYGMQLGPDEKIYVTKGNPSLGVINKPDIKGVGCNFQENQMYLTVSSQLGLPAFINDITDFNNGFTYTIIDSCSGNVQFQGSTTMPGTLQWQWDFGDGNTSNLQNPIHQFTPSDQNYVVKLKVTSSLLCGGSIQKSRIIKPSGTVTKVDFDLVNRCDSGYVRLINKTLNVQDIAGQYTWSFGDGYTSQDQDPIHSYIQPGTYTIKLKLNSTLPCLADSMETTIDIGGFNISVSPEQTILVGQSVQIFANGPATKYQWTPPIGLNDPAVSSPIASPLEDIVYKIKATDDNGCFSEDSVKVNVIQFNDFYVPSAFTPNNDGKNDVIRPFFGGKYTLLEFTVYNRWGEKVFTTSTRSDGWNGYFKNKIQSSGVYIWILRAVDENKKAVERKGTLVLLR